MRAALPLLFITCAGLTGGCREKRRPIARGDAGPAVVVVDHHAPDLGLAAAESEREPNDAPASAQPLPADHRIGGTLALAPAGGKPDLDCYALASVPGAPGPTDAGPPPSVAFVTVQAAAEPVALDILDAGGKAILTRVAPAHGRAWLSYLRLDSSPTVVRVRRPPGQKTAPTVPAEYTIEQSTRVALPGEELEPNDDVARAMPLPDGGALTGRLDGEADRDTLVLPPRTDGATYRVELGGVPDLAPELRLRDGDTVLATARQGRGGELRLRNLPSTGKLSLQLRALEGAGDQPYTLRVSVEPAIDAAVEHEPNDDRARANPIKVGDAIAGYLWPGDVDWFCASAPGLGAQIDPMPEVDWKLELFDETGKSLSKADEGKRGAGENLPADPRARCVRLSARPRDTVFELPYRLSFTSPP